MKLYFGGLSPFVRKVMIAAHELGIRDKIETEKAMVTPFKTNNEVAAVTRWEKSRLRSLRMELRSMARRSFANIWMPNTGRGRSFPLTISAGRRCVWQLWEMAFLKQEIWPGSRRFAPRAPNGKTGGFSKWAKSSARSLPLRTTVIS